MEMVSESGPAHGDCRAGALQLSITVHFPLLSKWTALHFDIVPFSPSSKRSLKWVGS